MRSKEAQRLRVQVIAVACPFCMIMLEDALKALSDDVQEVKILDVAEILHLSGEKGEQV